MFDDYLYVKLPDYFNDQLHCCS